MAATEKNNADLPLLVGNTMINGTRGDGWCTNCNALAWPSDWGWALGPYMRCNPNNALELGTSGTSGPPGPSWLFDFARRAGETPGPPGPSRRFDFAGEIGTNSWLAA